MFLISIRKHLADPHDFSSSDYLLFFRKTGDANLFEPVPDFFSHISGKRLLVAIHGYNNPFKDVISSYEEIEKLVKKYGSNDYDEIVGFSWPSGNSSVDYYSARERAVIASDRLRIWINRMLEHAGSVDIIAHSMGAQLGINMLNTGLDRPLRYVFSLAPAINTNDLVQFGDRLNQFQNNFERVLLFHNPGDAVLKYAYSIAERSASIGLNGVVNLKAIQNKIISIDCSGHVASHQSYFHSPFIFKMIHEFLEQSK